MFGYNSRLPVHSLMDGEDWVLLYVSSHTVVIHDILRNKQFHLQVWHTAKYLPPLEPPPSISLSGALCSGVTYKQTQEQPIQKVQRKQLQVCSLQGTLLLPSPRATRKSSPVCV